MTLHHVVSLGFDASVSEASIKEALDNIKAFTKTCLHPTTNLPYIKSFKGGRNNSLAGRSGPYTHLIILEFEDVEGRDYFMDKDPVHLANIAQVNAGAILIKEAQILDFVEDDY